MGEVVVLSDVLPLLFVVVPGDELEGGLDLIESDGPDRLSLSVIPELPEDDPEEGIVVLLGAVGVEGIKVLGVVAAGAGAGIVLVEGVVIGLVVLGVLVPVFGVVLVPVFGVLLPVLGVLVPEVAVVVDPMVVLESFFVLLSVFVLFVVFVSALGETFLSGPVVVWLEMMM